MLEHIPGASKEPQGSSSSVAVDFTVTIHAERKKSLKNFQFPQNSLLLGGGRFNLVAVVEEDVIGGGSDDGMF